MSICTHQEIWSFESNSPSGQQTMQIVFKISFTVRKFSTGHIVCISMRLSFKKNPSCRKPKPVGKESVFHFAWMGTVRTPENRIKLTKIVKSRTAIRLMFPTIDCIVLPITLILAHVLIQGRPCSSGINFFISFQYRYWWLQNADISKSKCTSALARFAKCFQRNRKRGERRSSVKDGNEASKKWICEIEARSGRAEFVHCVLLLLQ